MTANIGYLMKTKQELKNGAATILKLRKVVRIYNRNQN
jgi:hypothetical protein